MDYRMKKTWRAICLALTVVIATMGMGVGASTASADAGNRPNLRPGCYWDEVGWWVQNCGVFSPAMDREIRVQIKPSANGGNRGLYLLDGMRARDDWNAWTHDSRAQEIFENDNVNLVMPVGGASSFYTDWNVPSPGKPIYKWQTFLTRELPDYLYVAFGVSKQDNAVVGLSMGGTAALNLAGQSGNQFAYAASLSGYLDTTAPGLQTMIRLAMLEAGGYDAGSMWGGYNSEQWYANNPKLNFHKLGGKKVYVSAGTGLYGPYDHPISLQDHFNSFNGAVLEGLSRLSTQDYAATFQVDNNLRPVGTHSWPYWNDELQFIRPAILSTIGG